MDKRCSTNKLKEEEKQDKDKKDKALDNWYVAKISYVYPTTTEKQSLL